MNISKRLLTVLMCVAMVVSMMSSFGYALGGATGSAVTDAIDDSVAVKGEPLTGTAISNGANPTTNVAAPVIDNEKTLVYDPAATAESTGNYNLAEKFTDMSTGLAVPGSENWTAVYGVNLFSDWHTLYKAKPDNATILVVNGVTTLYSFRHDGDTTVYTTKNFSVYSPYFNVMPYTTGSALDGSDWAANPNWAGPSVTWPGNNFEVGEWNIYGFKLNNYMNTLKTLGGGDAMQLRLTNCAWDLSTIPDYGKSNGFLYTDADDKHTALNTTGSELILKNVHFYGHVSGARFMWGPQAQTVVFDGCFLDGIAGESNYWMKPPSGGPAGTSVTFTNSNFQNVSTLFWIWQLNEATKVSFTKNIFNNSQMTRTGTGHGSPVCGILGSIYSAGDFEISNNRFFSTDADRPLFTGYTSGSRVFTITGNYFGQGVNPTLDFVAASQTAKDGSVCKYNYSVTGNPVVSNRTAGFSADSFVDYLDAGMTKTAESLYPTEVTATKGTLSIDMGARKIGWLVTDGVLDLTALTVTLAAGTIGSWETTPTDFGTYTYNITDGVYSTFFTVEITKPENLFSDVYLSDGIITKDAILLDSASESTATGMIYTAAWDGKEYNFIKGTNAFATVKEYEAWAKANGTSGHQIICRTKPLKGLTSSQTNHLYLEVPAKYYSLNYKTPLLTHNADGTKTYTAWSSNTWTYDGFGFPNNSAYGAFDPAAGTYELHGFAHNRWELYYQKINNIKFVMENCSINIQGQKLYGTDEGKFIDLWDGDQGGLAFENCYINRSGSSTTRWFNGGQAANFAIRNCFWDDTSTAAESNEPYIKQYSKNSTLDISDNYFKNYNGKWYFEGNNRKNGESYVEASEREFTFNNNVFENSKLSQYGAVMATAHGFNKITAIGNVFDHGTASNLPLIYFHGSYSSASNTGTNVVPLEIKVEDNYIINGADLTIDSNRTMADESLLSIKNNYVTRDGKAVGLYETNGKVPAGNYWLNPEMTVSNTAVVIESVSANDGGETVLDNKTYEIFYNLASSESTLNDLVVNVPDGATVTFHTDAACETEAIADLTNIAGGEKVYLKSAVAEGYLIYSVTLVSAEKYFFEENYYDYSDFGIDGTNAYLITDEVAGLPNGAIVNLEWKGEAFDFEVGRTVFANQAVFHQYVVDNTIENPDVLVKTMKENLVVNYPSRWFTQNYDINPVVKDYETVEEALSSGVPGDGWAFNEEWNSEYDTGISFDNLMIGRTDALGRSEAVAGDYLFAGFKFNYTFVNDSTDTNVELWNTYFTTNNWGGNSSTEVVTSSGNALFSFGNSGNVGTTKVTNVYVKPNGQYKPSGALFTGYAGKELTVDNMFTDATPVVYNGNANATIRVAADGVLTIKNSFFKNFSIANQSLAGNNASAITEGVTSDLVFENNILINSMFQGQYNGALSFRPDTLTSVTIARNYIDNRDKAAWGNSTSYRGTQLVGTNGGSLETPSPVVAQVYDNYLIGLHSNTGTWGGRLYDEEQSYISNNFATFDLTPGKDIFEMEGTYFSYFTDEKASVIPVLDWKLDAIGEATSNQLVAGSTFDGVEISAGEPVEYGVELTTETINLRDLFVSEGNYIDVYSDPSCTAEFDLSMSNLVVPAAGGTFYVKIAPIIYSVNPDIDPLLADEPMIITLNITKEEGFAIKNEGLGVGELAKEGAEKDFYWLSWRGSVFIAGETVEGDSGHRAGIIYYSSESSLNTFEEKLNEAAMNFTSADDIDAALEVINAEIRAADTTIIGYALDKNKTLVWDSVTQSYGYRYNFAVEEGNIRGAKCYVVYYNADTEAYEVMISDQVVQKVPAPEVAA